MPEEHTRALAEALIHMKEAVHLCSVCANITDRDPCPICRSDARDKSMVCVVEEPLDILAIERTRVYKGTYHVLHGAISPLENVGPEHLKIPELLRRLQDGAVKEVILATNPNIEGGATAMYLEQLIRPLGVRVTRIRTGLPVGGDLEFADEITLARALEGRGEL